MVFLAVVFVPAFAVGFVVWRELRRWRRGAVTLIDTTGRPLMPWLEGVGKLIVAPYLPDTLVWAVLPHPGYPVDAVRSGSFYYTLLTRRGQRVIPEPVMVRYAGPGVVRTERGDIYTVSGQWLGNERDSYILPGGWVVLRQGAVLRDPAGKEHLPPAGWLWDRSFSPRDSGDNYQFAPFEQHVMGIYQ